MTLDLAENVSTVPIPAYILKVELLKTLKIDLKIDFREPGPKRLIYTSDQNRDYRAKTLA